MTEESLSAQQHPRILVVDDEEAIRLLLITMLRRGGDWDIQQAQDAPAAQVRLIDQQFDLVITDLAMPGVSGLALMQWAKDRGMAPDWIILTGHGTFEDAIKAVRMGAFDFITKPLDSPDALTLRVRNVLRQRLLENERRKLNAELQQRNIQLRQQVSQLRDACSLLCTQAESIANDLRRAEIIQRALLPAVPPDLHDFSLSAVYRPSNNVGGDLYDVVRLGDRYAVIYLADAAGHGVSAAMLAVLFKENLRVAHEMQLPTPPAEVLRLANNILLGECRALGLFVTAAYCLLDLEQRTITVASAGHPPLILHRQEGGIEEIFHTGPALGVSAQARFAEKTIELHDGDRLLFYTDGIFNAPEGAAKLTASDLTAALSSGQLHGQELLNWLMAEAARRRKNAPQDDDITLIMLSAAREPSVLDNGSPEKLAEAASLPLPAAANVLIGRGPEGTAISIQGQGRWNWCPAFHEACLAEIRARRPVLLDMSMCDYLDSTFLGTIQEICQDAAGADVPLSIQGVLPELHHLLEELGMNDVLRHVVEDMRPLPGQMSPLPSSLGDSDQDRARILQAHEALASLSESNREKFYALIEALRAEMQQV